MRKAKLQQMATKFYLKAVLTAKAKKQRLISINSNESFITLRRVLRLLKKENIEASFESFLDFRKKPVISFISFKGLK